MTDICMSELFASAALLKTLASLSAAPQKHGSSGHFTLSGLSAEAFTYFELFNSAAGLGGGAQRCALGTFNWMKV